MATEPSLIYAGRADGIEAMLSRAHGLEFRPVAAAPLRGRDPVALVRNLRTLASGTLEARRTLSELRPDAVFATGGYASVPVVLAARDRGIPSLVYLPDVEPGWAVRFLSRLATRIAVTASSATRYFDRRKVVVTGYPVRRELFELSKSDGRAQMGLRDGPVLVVVGGSRGATSINCAVRASLEALVSRCELVHVAGQADLPWLASRREALPEHSRSRYHLYGFLDKDMPAALVSGDLVVCRAGASVLGELPAARVPGLLIPYPYAGRHQKANADYLVAQGAARMLGDDELPSRFLPTVLQLLDDSDGLDRMRVAARGLARPEAARRIAEELVGLGCALGGQA